MKRWSARTRFLSMCNKSHYFAWLFFGIIQVGCVTLPAPSSIDANLPLEERKARYERLKISEYKDWKEESDGLGHVPTHFLEADVPKWFQACGCADASALTTEYQKKDSYWKSIQYIGIGMIAIGYFAVPPDNGSSRNLAIATGAATIAFTAPFQIPLPFRYWPKIARSYNQCLGEKLKLSEFDVNTKPKVRPPRWKTEDWIGMSLQFFLQLFLK